MSKGRRKCCTREGTSCRVVGGRGWLGERGRRGRTETLCEGMLCAALSPGGIAQHFVDAWEGRIVLKPVLWLPKFWSGRDLNFARGDLCFRASPQFPACHARKLIERASAKPAPSGLRPQRQDWQRTGMHGMMQLPVHDIWCKETWKHFVNDEWLDVPTRNSTTPAKRISDWRCFSRVKCRLSLPVLVIEGDAPFSWSSGCCCLHVLDLSNCRVSLQKGRKPFSETRWAPGTRIDRRLCHSEIETFSLVLTSPLTSVP